MRRFIKSERAPWGVLDTWLNQGQPIGIFTVLADHAQGKDWLEQVKGSYQGVWGFAVVDRVAVEPTDRMRLALDQSKRRQGTGLIGSGHLVQGWSRPDPAPKKAPIIVVERPLGAPRSIASGEPEIATVLPRYSQDRFGAGRWVRLYRFGVPIGTLWTDDAQALGFIPEPEACVALLINSIGSACALGTPTSWVFEDHAAWSSKNHWAGPVQTGDLATLGSGWGPGPPTPG
jgi:hypothetical protein